MDFLGEGLDHGLVERFFVMVCVKRRHRAPPFIYCLLPKILGPAYTGPARPASVCRLFDFHHSMRAREDIAAKD
jgi:hypothetical protein